MQIAERKAAFKNHPIIKKIRPLASRCNAFLVGGYIRDALVGRRSSDLDFVVFKDIPIFVRMLSETLSISFFTLGQDKQVLRSCNSHLTIDVSSPRAESIKLDLSKRDISINAIAYDFNSEFFIDPVDGIADIENGIIRIISETAVKEDPLRMLRAFRIAAELKFEIHQKSMQIVDRNKQLIAKSASERIGYEFSRLLEFDCYPYLVQMNKIGLIDQLFPGFIFSNGCIQNRFHLYDVKEHSLRTVKEIEKMFDDVDSITMKCADSKKLILKNKLTLKLAAFFHDIGKPSVKTSSNDCIHFYRHEQRSAAQFKKIASALSLTKNKTKIAADLILNHLAAVDYLNLYKKSLLLKKYKIRFFNRFGENGILILFLSIADTLAKGNISESLYTNLLNLFLEFQRFYFDYYLPKIETPPLITGYDLINELKLSPSRRFKTILNNVREEQMKGNLDNKISAMKYAAEIVSGYTKR